MPPHDSGLPDPGHNHSGHDHLHSHVHGTPNSERVEELQGLATSFIEGFRAAEDKTSYLRLSGIAFHREGADGRTLHLVDAKIVSNWQVGTASPAFASKELAYLPFPGSMVQTRETMAFTYVSMTEKEDLDLLEILIGRLNEGEIPG